jgi:hypothetical protein
LTPATGRCARVTSVSADLEPPLDFAVAEADIVDAGVARDVQIGTLGDVRAVASSGSAEAMSRYGGSRPRSWAAGSSTTWSQSALRRAALTSARVSG